MDDKALQFPGVKIANALMVPEASKKIHFLSQDEGQWWGEE